MSSDAEPGFSWPGPPTLLFFWVPVAAMLVTLAVLPTWLLLQLRAEDAREAANPTPPDELEDENVDHGPGGEGHGGVNPDGTAVDTTAEETPKSASRRKAKRK